MGRFRQCQALCPIFSSDWHNRAFINLIAAPCTLAGNISSKSNLTQQDPSDLSTSQSLQTYYFRDETINRNWISQAFGKLELLQKCFQLPPSFHLRWLHLESAELFCRVLLHAVIVKLKSAPYYCFPELTSSCYRASSAPPRTSSFSMAILAEPFHPSCLKSITS